MDFYLQKNKKDYIPLVVTLSSTDTKNSWDIKAINIKIEFVERTLNTITINDDVRKTPRFANLVLQSRNIIGAGSELVKPMSDGVEQIIKNDFILLFIKHNKKDQ